MTRGYGWLPDHHLGVAATLAHADQVLEDATNILHEYQSQADGILQFREVAVDTYSETVVTRIAPIPKKVPLLVADALVALRNAIEHTIFAEVEHRDGELDQKAARLVEMPAATTYVDFQEWIKRRQKNGPPSLRAGSEVLRRIDALQPYHRTHDPEAHPMAVLAAHSNYSKHRAPAITAVRLAAIHREDQSPPSMADVQRLPEVPLRVGDVIARTPLGVRIPVALFPTIGINRPGTTRWPVLIKELDELSHWVRTQAVPRLVTGTDPPTPSLPTQYDIAIGHNDERRALSAGSTVPAAARFGERLGAEVARRHLVEVLARMPGAPRHERLVEWLAALSDREVVARMTELQVTPNYDPSTMRRNLIALQRMLDASRDFIDVDAELINEHELGTS